MARRKAEAGAKTSGQARGTFDLHYRTERPKGLFDSAREEVMRILSLPFFNRYSDKTQVYYLMENDDITHRGHHVYKVSFLSRLVASALGLNEGLCESISLSHDLGHPPFAHSGERFLDRILSKKAGMRFNHAMQSVRVVEDIFPLNLSLETLCGIACHSGFLFDDEGKIDNPDFFYPLDTFEGFDSFMSSCRKEGPALVKSSVSPTLEGRAVRICDIISYIFRDREDALLIGYDLHFSGKTESLEGERLFISDIISSSVSTASIRMSRGKIAELQSLRRENTELIYSSSDFNNVEWTVIYPLFESLFMRILDDLRKCDRSSIAFRHHIDYIDNYRKARGMPDAYDPYRANHRAPTEKELFCVAADFISSMSDDYFLSICRMYFPSMAKKLKLTGYFEGLNPDKRRKITRISTPSLFAEEPD